MPPPPRYPSSGAEVVEALWPLLIRRMGERAASAIDLLDELLHSYGPVRRQDHELRAGDRVLNEDREVLPRVARATSLGLSIYLGNRRIASFGLLDAGSGQQLGAYADAALVETVLRKREVYRGELDVGGRPHLVACRPLFATSAPDDYGPMGMIEAFQDLTSFREVLSAGLRGGPLEDGRSATEEQADRMESVTHFIDDVARRLQLLALNGNIIAAQAGDHGRAFRVVCRELSSLAEQAKDAVADVRRLTEEIGLAREEPEPDVSTAPPGDG